MNSNIKDENIRLDQIKLIDKGDSVGSCGADGYFGRDTLAAVRRFQEGRGLSVDGVVGESTWNKLIE